MVPVTIETRKVISANEFSLFVSKHYGRPYSLEDQGSLDDVGIIHIEVPDLYAFDYENETVDDYDAGVNFKSWLNADPNSSINGKFEKSDIKLFWFRKFYPELATLLNDLHSRGLIESGDYDIISE